MKKCISKSKAARIVRNILRELYAATGANVKSKSTPKSCINPLAHNRALNRRIRSRESVSVPFSCREF